VNNHVSPSTSMRVLLIVVAVSVLAASLSPGCTTTSTQTTATTHHTTSSTVPLAVINTSDRELEVELELALTWQEQQTGLMYRTYLDRDAGMLFVFSFDAEHGFWMKNTLIPLDMVYISLNGTVVHIRHQAQPLDETIYHPPVPCRYVLEVNGGFCSTEGVAVGDLVDFIGF